MDAYSACASHAILTAICYVALNVASEAVDKKWTIKQLLKNQFSSITPAHASEICGTCPMIYHSFPPAPQTALTSGCWHVAEKLKLDDNEKAAALTEANITRLRDIFVREDFPAPDGSVCCIVGVWQTTAVDTDYKRLRSVSAQQENTTCGLE